MSRVLVVPAAGRGTRLGRPEPKLLVPVHGRAMIDHVLDRHRHTSPHSVVVVSPSAVAAVERHLAGRTGVSVAIQAQPTGMLDAILAATELVRPHAPAEVWISWCDQVATSQRTLDRLAVAMATHRRPPWPCRPSRSTRPTSISSEIATGRSSACGSDARAR